MTSAAARRADGPSPLPFCDYPRGADTARHGLQPLPAALPLLDLEAAAPYRSHEYVAVSAADLRTEQVLELAWVVGSAFARREPTLRHVRPPAAPPASLDGARWRDPFGTAAFGPWTKEGLMYWFIRTLVLTDPSSPADAIAVHEAALAQSIAVLDRFGRVVGGALNETMPPADVAPAFREDDPFLAATSTFAGPALEMLAAQDAEALGALCDRYPAFARAYADGQVGHHFMVARADSLPTVDAFELVAATAERYRASGFAYMVVEASNQWTGAACEVLGGVRVHFAPFRARASLPRSGAPLPEVVTSPDGFLSAKDSGCMFYVIRLA